MGERLSYDELSEHFLHLYSTIACRGNSRLPIFSRDLSVALQVRHRVVKDFIEAHFEELHHAYGPSIQIVREKRGYGCRAMRGYLLPFCAVAQLFLVFDRGKMLLQERPEFLYACISSGSSFFDSLN